MLEDEGYVRSREEDGKKIYAITDAGREYLDEHGDIVEEIVDRVTSFADRFWGKESRDLSAAFSKLASSTFESAFNWGLTSESLKEITDILEQAFSDIQGVRKKGKEEAPGAEDAHEEPPAEDAPPEEGHQTDDSGMVKDEEEH
jgi:hypothetical protein